MIGAILRPHLRLVAWAGAAMVVATAISLAAPLLVKLAIDHGIAKHDAHAVNTLALAYLVLVVLRPVAERVIVLGSARAGERFLGDLRVAAYDKLQELSLPFFEETRAGVLVSRLTADVQTLSTFTRTVLVEIVGSVLLFCVSVVILVWLSPALSLVLLVSVPLLAWSSIRYGKRSRPAFLALRDRVADTMTTLQEGLTGVRVVQSFGQEQERYATYRARSREQVTAWRRISLVNIGFFPAIAFAQALALAAVLVAGGYLERHGRVTVGTIVAFALYLISLFDPIARLGDWYSEFQSGRAALAKIDSLLRTPPTVVGGSTALPPRGALRAEDVTFAYGESAPAVDAVTLEVATGEHLALVGATGAGKSTLAKLLVRGYDPRRGRITFGGVDLRHAPLEELRSRIVFVPQEGHLFSGSIADNVRLARPDASDDDVREALRAIGALDRLDALPDGLATDVRSRGVRLSSGERQLVSIARVALVDPAVIVLDEATSSLDPQTEAAVEHALSVLAHGRTMITIAHRLSTAERADRVAVMEHGRLVEIAAHDELVAQGERYARLWASWQAGLAVSEREDPLADPAHVEPERRVVLGTRPVQLDEAARDADREQLRRPVRERRRDLRCGRPLVRRLDQHDLRRSRGLPRQGVRIERHERRGVQHRRVDALEGVERAREERAGREDRRVGASPHDRETTRRELDHLTVLGRARAQVRRPAVRVAPAKQRVRLRRRARHQHLETRDAAERLHVAGRMVRPAGLAVVVGGAGRDERAAEPLVAEVELDLLERTLRQEGRERMHDRMEALEREAGCDPNRTLLHDPGIHGPPRIVVDRGPKVVEADVRHHDRDALVVLEELDRGRHRLLAHRGHWTTATTAVGLSARCRYAARNASRSRPSTVAASQPNARSLPAMSPSSTVLDRLSTTISVRFESPTEPACRIASQFEPSFSSASPVSTKTRCSFSARARSAYATPTAIGRP